MSIDRLSEEEQWIVRERYGLYKDNNQEANALSNEDVCQIVGIPPGELRNILKGKAVPHLGKKRDKAKRLVAKRDRHRSLAAPHHPTRLMEEFRLTKAELSKIVL